MTSDPEYITMTVFFNNTYPIKYYNTTSDPEYITMTGHYNNTHHIEYYNMPSLPLSILVVYLLFDCCSVLGSFDLKKNRIDILIYRKFYNFRYKHIKFDNILHCEQR